MVYAGSGAMVDFPFFTLHLSTSKQGKKMNHLIQINQNNLVIFPLPPKKTLKINNDGLKLACSCVAFILKSCTIIKWLFTLRFFGSGSHWKVSPVMQSADRESNWN